MMKDPENPSLLLSSETVRSRFRQALRQGNPEWLWPEVSLPDWKAAVHAIDGVVRDILTGDRVPVLEGNAQDIGIAAFTSGMGPLLGFWARQNMLEAEPPIRSVLDLHYSHNLNRMRQLADSALVAVEALSEARIEVTALKGMHTAYTFFPTPACRPMSDIDLLIASSQEQRASLVLQSLGYFRDGGSYGEKTFRMKGVSAVPRTLSFLHEDNPWSIDLHTTLDRRYSPGAPMIRMDRAVWNAHAAWFISPKARVLTGEELVVQLAYHASLGLVSLSLLRLTEIVLVIRKLDAENHLSWDRVIRTADKTGVVSCIYPALGMVDQLAPGTVPSGVLRILERNAPLAVRSLMARLQPATCQRLVRYSFRERFMWTNTGYGWAREIFLSLFPKVSLKQMLDIYLRRFLILSRGRVS